MKVSAKPARATRRPKKDRRALGALLLFLYFVVPFGYSMTVQGLGDQALWIAQGLLLACLAVEIPGAYWLTGGGRDDGISDELRASTRLAALAHVGLSVVANVAVLSRDLQAAKTFKTASEVCVSVMEALLFLVANRIFATRGESAKASATKVLAGVVLLEAALRYGYRYLPYDPAELTGPLRVIVALSITITFWDLRRAFTPKPDPVADTFT